MTSYPGTLTAKKVDQDGIFYYKDNNNKIKIIIKIIIIYYICSSNDPNITNTKNHIRGKSHFK
jgi:hypothetical protein